LRVSITIGTHKDFDYEKKSIGIHYISVLQILHIKLNQNKSDVT
jgi:hypothetical protein